MEGGFEIGPERQAQDHRSHTKCSGRSCKEQYGTRGGRRLQVFTRVEAGLEKGENEHRAITQGSAPTNGRRLSPDKWREREMANSEMLLW